MTFLAEPPTTPVAHTSAPATVLNIVIADDFEATRVGLSHVMGLAGHRVVRAVSSAVEVVEEVRRGNVDVVLLDMLLPKAAPSPLGPSAMPSDTTASEWALQTIRETDSGVVVVGISGYVQAPIVERMCAAGMNGFAHKLASSAEMVAIVEASAAPGASANGVLDRFTERELLSVMRCRLAAAESGLSDDERQLLGLLASGHTLLDAAAELCVSRSTANRMMAACAAKLGCSSRSETIAAAVERRLLT